MFGLAYFLDQTYSMSNLFIGIDVLSHPRTVRLRAWLEPQWQRAWLEPQWQLRSETSRPETCLKSPYLERTDRRRLWNDALAWHSRGKAPQIIPYYAILHILYYTLYYYDYDYTTAVELSTRTTDYRVKHHSVGGLDITLQSHIDI